MQVAAVRERTSFAEPLVVEPVEKEARPRLCVGRLVDDARRRGRADHHRGSPAREATGADVRARAVAERGPDACNRLVGERRELGRLQSERSERLLVPRELVRVEEAGPARGRHARARLAGEPQKEVVAEREVAGGSNAFAGEAIDLRGPVRRVEEAPGATVVVLGVQLRRRACAVLPRQHGRERPIALIHRNERMPEARDRERVALADLREHGTARIDEAVGVELVVGELRVAGLGLSVLVVRDRADRRRANIERDDPRQAATSSGSSGISTRNVVPSPGIDVTSIVPPCASAIAREMTRPRPVPGIACSVAVDERKKRWNRRLCSPSGMPMPVSAISTTARPPSTNARDHASSRGRELERVRDEVADELREPLLVAGHRRHRVDLGDERDLARAGERSG